MDTILPATHDTIDPRCLRRALGNFATGVTIMTARDDVRPVGVTANSFSSVSLDPPLILWSISKRSGSYPVFEQASHFAVNVLAADQIALSNQFAHPREDRFAGVDYRHGRGQCLLLEGTAAGFQCEKFQTLDGGDHWILLGKVVGFEDHGRSPLLYHQGSYAMALPHPHRDPAPPASPAANHLRSRLADHPYYLMTQAVRGYQQAYQPEQIRTGWRPGEARILMILDVDPGMDVAELVREADMPRHEVLQTLELLRSRSLVAPHPQGGYGLTAAGHEQAREIWLIAHRHEQRVFAGFEPTHIEAFKTVLRGIIARTNAS